MRARMLLWIDTPCYTIVKESEMDEKTKELVAIGASVSSHCQPCLTFHLNRARELGVNESEVQEAIDVGHMVGKGAGSAMEKFTGELLNPMPQQGQPCCPDRNARCCG